MWSKRSTSGSPEFPDRPSLIRALVNKLVAEKLVGAWVHLELVNEAGWFSNLLSGKAPWIELALDEDGFQLNPGFSKQLQPALPQFPEDWKKRDGKLGKVSVSQVDAVCGWIDAAFNSVCANSQARKISGWIEGS